MYLSAFRPNVWGGVIITLFLLFSTQHSLKATHAMGADLTYECIGPNQYLIQLSFYRDCRGIAPLNSYSVTVSSPSCGVNTSMTVSLAPNYPQDITPLCASTPSACGGGGTYGVQQYVFEGIVNLPPGCSDWSFGWTECCRNGAITTLNDPSNQDFYVEAQLNDNISPCNNSPIFNNTPTPFICVGGLVSYNHGVSDPDGDDLVFSLVNCNMADNNSVNYSGGFSGTNPLTATGLTIDPNTGALSFTPTAIQVGVLCVLVEEYRDGVKIGEVVRDMQFTVINCSNQAPASSGIDNACDISGPSGDYQISICAQEPLCFDLLACDANGDNVNVFWNEGIPGATLTVNGNNTANPSAEFCWTPTANDEGINFFTVTVQDDACPIIGSNTYTYTIEVIPNPNEPVEAGPDQFICGGESVTLSATSSANNIVSYSWSPADGLSNPNSPTTTTPTIDQTTVYTITTVYGDGCQDQDYVTITVLDDPSVNVFPQNIPVCGGGTASVTATTNLDPSEIASFEWFDGATSLGNGTTDGSTNTITLSPTASTDYNVVVTGVNGCTNSATVSVTLNDTPLEDACVNLYVDDTVLSPAAGTQADPTTLVDAIDRAACNSVVIKMDQGTYNINEALFIRSYVTLEGGFDRTAGWVKSSTPGLTTIHRSATNIEDEADAAPRLVAIYGNSVVGFRLQDLTITTDNAPAPSPGNAAASTYGIHLTACGGYDIVRCQIQPGTGGTGEVGATGAAASIPGGTGGTGGASNTGCDNGGANGNPGSPGSGGANGGGGGNGSNPDNCNFFGCNAEPRPGFPGNPGNPGANGTSASATPPTTNAPSFPFFIPNGQAAAGTDGTSGGGGGGGGGMSKGTDCLCSYFGNGAGGQGGQGGAAGTGGTGGYGGGGSFGIYLAGNLGGNIEDSDILQNTPSSGGGGGQGGQGNNGSPGAGGQNAGCGGSSATSGAGGTGGSGGNGGNGQPGANGLSAKLVIDGSLPTFVQSGGAVALASGSNNPADFNLPSQPTITAGNVNCTNTPTAFTGAASTWGFDPADTPPTPSGTAVTASFPSVDRHDVMNGGEVYTGFHNVSFSGQTIPSILSDAPVHNLDTFRLCVGDIANFYTDVGASTYNWDFNGAITNPPNTEAIVSGNTFNNVGFFQIELFVNTDCCGDSPVDMAYLYVDPIATPDPVTDATICQGESATLSVSGTGVDSIIWSPDINTNYLNATSIEVSPPSTTVYTATIYSEQGDQSFSYICPEIVSFTVTVNEVLDLEFSSTDASCTPDGTATVSVLNSAGPFTYNWAHDAGLNNATASNLSAGGYEVTVTDNITGCTAEGGVFVYSSPVTPFPFVVNSENISCNGLTDGMIEIDVVNGTAPYTYAWSNGGTGTSINGLAEGDYTVTVSDNLGCTATLAVEIIEPEPVEITFTSEIQPDCATSMDGFIDMNALGGTAPLTYTWSNGGSTDTLQNLNAGTYTLTVTDANGCSATFEHELIPTVIILPNLSVTALLTCNGGTNGGVTAAPSGGTSPYAFAWADSNGPVGTGVPLDNVGAGTYYITITDDVGCQIMDSISLTEPTEVIASSSVNNQVSCNGGVDGSATITATGGTAPYSFLWPTGQTTPTVNDCPAGTFIVTITDSNGCTTTEDVTFTEPTEVLASANTDANASCNSAADGSATATGSGGTVIGDYQYLWSDGQTTANPTGLPPGTFTVTITDDNGCSATAETVVTEPTPLSLSATINNDVSCNGGADGSATITATGGTEPYTYLWSDGQTTATVNNCPAGTFITTVTDANGCTATIDVTFNEPDAVSASANVDMDVSCNGGADGSATAAGTGGTAAGGYLYLWSDSQTTAIATGLVAGNYTVTITDDNGCSATAETSITEPPLVSASANVDADVSCNGGADGSATAVGSGGTVASDYLYLWSDGQTNATATGLAAGDYTVTITDDNGCSATAETSIAEPAPVLASANVDAEVSCNGGADGSATATGSGGTISLDYQYLWSDGQTNAIATGLAAGNYTVTITDDNGCSATAETSIAEPTPVSASSNVDAEVSCNGGADGSATAVGSGGTISLDYQYLWSDGQTTAIATGLAAGDYTVTITDDNGCSATAGISITEPTPVLVSTNVDANVSCNGGADGSATAVGSGGTAAGSYQYLWNGGQTSPTITGLAAGIYTVTVTDDNGCSTTGEVTVQEPNPLALTTTQSDVSCAGGNDGSSSVSATGGTGAYSYVWSTSPPTLQDNASGLMAGIYTVTVTDENDCSETASVTIQEPAAMVATASMAQQQTSCDTPDGMASASVSNGVAPYTYDWGGQMGSDAVNLTAGNYIVTVTDFNGCTATAAVEITATFTISPTANITDADCNGSATGAIELTTTGDSPPFTYDWGSSSDNPYTGLAAGDYTVTIIDATGCSRQETYTVGEPAALVLTTLDIGDASCSDSADGSIEVDVFGGSPPYTYTWTGDAVGQDNTANGLGAGSYDLTVTDANGCLATSSFTIGAPIPVTVALDTSTPANCSACDGTATVTPSGGTGPYTYLWDNGSNSSSPTNLCAGINTVQVFDANGCVGVLDVNIDNVTTLEIDGITVLETSCYNGCDGEATVTASGGQMPYTYLWDANAGGQTTATATGLCAGTYEVVVMDADGCVAAEIATIGEPTPVSSTFEATDAVCFGEANGMISATGSTGGYGPYSYALDGTSFQSDTLLTGLMAGYHMVYTQDANGCVDSTEVFVGQPDSLYVNAFPVDTLISLSESVQLSAVASQNNDVTFVWTPSDSLSCADCPNPITYPTSTTEYTVVVTDTLNGCVATDMVTIRMDKTRAIFVPNAFSPNDDGFNETVTVYADGSVESIQSFRIVDRWGEVVFSRENFQPNDPTEGWDGRIGGKLMNPGVFVYLVEVRFIDGATVVFGGDITLLR